MTNQRRSHMAAGKKMLWGGRIISALPVLFLSFDGVIKLMNVAPVVEAQSQLGIPQSLTLSIGILELACVLIYAIPRTSILGAILLTGYIGGATAIQLRVANPLLTHVLFLPTWAPYYGEAFTCATRGCDNSFLCGAQSTVSRRRLKTRVRDPLQRGAQTMHCGLSRVSLRSSSCLPVPRSWSCRSTCSRRWDRLTRLHCRVCSCGSSESRKCSEASV